MARASKGKDEKAAEPNQSSDEAKQENAAKGHTKALIEAATWSVLNPADGVCTPPQDWLAHDRARIAAGPVVVPPPTDAVLDYWSATTEARSPHLSPHPFLYGLTEDDECTPLVGIAFRLEVEALRETTNDEDDTETPDAAADVLEIFKRFPPLPAELHQVSLSSVREWLDSPDAEKHPFVFRDHDQWRTKSASEPADDVRATLEPDCTLVLPASILMRESCKKLLEGYEQAGGKDTAVSDVFDGVSDPKRARYRRTIVPQARLSGGEGAWLWNHQDDENDRRTPPAKPDGFKQRLGKELWIGGKAFDFRYFRPTDLQSDLQFLDNHDGAPGHLSRASDVATPLAEAIAPGDGFLRTLLADAARCHDEGKRHPKWQRAFGRPHGLPEIAKLHPKLKKPAPLGGFRHEWKSLQQLASNGAMPPADLSPEAQTLWRDLLLHLVGASRSPPALYRKFGAHAWYRAR